MPAILGVSALLASGLVAAAIAPSSAPAHAEDTPFMLYNENWEANRGNPMRLKDYVGFDGSTYTSDEAADNGISHTSNCNGIVSSYSNGDTLSGGGPACTPAAPQNGYLERRYRSRALSDMSTAIQELMTPFPHWQYVNGEPKGSTQNVAVAWGNPPTLAGGAPPGVVAGLRVLEKKAVSVGTEKRTYRVQFSMAESACEGSFDPRPDRTSLSVYLKDGSQEIKIASGLSPCRNGSTLSKGGQWHPSWNSTVGNYRFDVPYASQSGTLGVVFRNDQGGWNTNEFALDDYKEGIPPLNPPGPTDSPTPTPTTTKGKMYGSFTPSTIDIGGASTYTLTLNTTDPAAFTIQAKLPTGVDVTGPVTSTCPGGAASGSAPDFTLTGSVNSTLGMCTFTFPVSSNTAGTYTVKETDVTSTSFTNYGEPTLTVRGQPGQVRIEKSGPASVQQGGRVDYTLRLTNLGPLATGAETTVIDSLPAGLTLLGTPTAQVGTIRTLPGSLVQWTVPAGLAAGSYTATLSGTVPASAAVGSSVTNTVNVTSGNCNGIDCSAQVTTTVTAAAVADMSATKVNSLGKDAIVSPGQEFSYDIELKNSGDAAASGVVFNDRLPIGLEFYPTSQTGWVFSGRTATSTPINVAAKSSQTLTLKVRVAANVVPGSQLVNLGTIKGMSPIDECVANPKAPGCAKDNDPPSVGKAEVEVSKKNEFGATTTVVPGQQFTYTVSARNIGTIPATGLKLTDTLPAGLEFAGTNQPGWTITGRTATSETFSLVPNQRADYTLKVRVAADATTGMVLRNVAVQQGGPSPNSCLLNPKLPGCGVDPYPPRVDADVIIAFKTSNVPSGKPVVVGTPIRYTITVRNTGLADAVNVSVTDLLPSELAFPAGPQQGWTIGTRAATSDPFPLKAGESRELTLNAVAAQASASTTRNVVAISSYSLILPLLASSSASPLAKVSALQAIPVTDLTTPAECQRDASLEGCAAADVAAIEPKGSAAASSAPSSEAAQAPKAEGPSANQSKAQQPQAAQPKADDSASAQPDKSDPAATTSKAASPAPAKSSPISSILKAISTLFGK